MRRKRTAGATPYLDPDAGEAIDDARGRWASLPAHAASQHVSGMTPTTVLGSHLGPQDAPAQDETHSPAVPQWSKRTDESPHTDIIEAIKVATAAELDERNENRRE